jgi:hypothetical protein
VANGDDDYFIDAVTAAVCSIAAKAVPLERTGDWS